MSSPVALAQMQLLRPRDENWYPLKGKRALLVDPHDASRSVLRDIVAALGCRNFMQARSYAEAIKPFETLDARTPIDIVFCEHNLHGPRTGQQMLEELRHRGLLPLPTSFFMVTGERGYRRVVSAAEFAPDAYLLKPFSPSILHERLRYVLEKKRVLAPAYALIDSGQPLMAAQVAAAVGETHEQFKADGWRLAIELYTAAGESAQAEALLEKVMALKAVPWAALGLARIRVHEGKLEEAEQLLSQLLVEKPELLRARDVLADIQEQLGKPEAALATLEAATGASDGNVLRLRRLGRLASALGQHEKASAALSAALERTRDSAMVSGQDFADLAASLCAQGRHEEAGKVAFDQRRMMKGHPDSEFSAALIQLHQSLPQPLEARAQRAARLLELVAADAAGALTPQLVVRAVGCCFDASLSDIGFRLATLLSQRGDLPPAIVAEIRELLDKQHARAQSERHLTVEGIGAALDRLEHGYDNELAQQVASSIDWRHSTEAGDDAALQLLAAQAERLAGIRRKFGIGN